MTTDAKPVRRALVSVSDKAGVVDFARGLTDAGAEIVSTGGTARALREAGIDVVEIDKLTGSPEMLSGRVKTLHPKVHGGILYRRGDDEHEAQVAEHQIPAIDLVCVNLYPFEQTVAKEGVTRAEAVEQIDIGGPSMVRSAAKNHESVAIVTSPEQYERVLAGIREEGGTSEELRRALAREAFALTSAYDAAIAGYLAGETPAPERLVLSYERVRELRYGENPHQTASLYAQRGARRGLLAAEQLHGKELSYNNLNDAQAALDLARAIAAVGGRVGSCVVKHANPCGAAEADACPDAVRSALAGDPLAAFGGILAVTGEVDEKAAEHLCAEIAFLEVVIAPSYTDGALARLRERWKNLRVLAAPGAQERTEQRWLRPIEGGLLVQSGDGLSDAAGWTHAAGPEPDEGVRRVARFLEPVARALASNAVCLGIEDADGCRLVGAGAGQMDRVAACRNAIEKAGELARGAVVFSDAFFPFADGPTLLADAGVRAMVHPGGSKRDGETFGLCDERGITCLTTGVRHFRH